MPLVRQLRLFKDKSNLLPSGGRIHTRLWQIQRNSPSYCHQGWIKLIIDAHIRQLHLGENTTLTALCQRYWIPSGRQIVKKTTNKCVTSRKICGTAYNTPDPPPLPKARLRETRLFEITGVDFTGALHVKESGTECKAYICLFTCATTRAIHLEVLTDMSLSTFIQAFRRFSARKSAQTYDVGQRHHLLGCS